MRTAVCALLLLISFSNLIFVIDATFGAANSSPRCELTWQASGGGERVLEGLNFVEADDVKKAPDSWSHLARSKDMQSYGYVFRHMDSALLGKLPCKM